jgi:hypothetical protein
VLVVGQNDASVASGAASLPAGAGACSMRGVVSERIGLDASTSSDVGSPGTVGP